MAEYIERETLEKKLNERLAYLLDKNGPYDHFTDGYDEAVSTVEEFPDANVTPIEALERLRDELYEQDLITMEGLKRLNTLIGKYTTTHEIG